MSRQFRCLAVALLVVAMAAPAGTVIAQVPAAQKPPAAPKAPSAQKAPAAQPAPAAQKAPPVQKNQPVGKVEVKVEVSGGGELQTCTLYLKERAVELAKGATTALLEEVPQARYALAGDATVKTAAGEIKRYVGIEPVAVGGNKTAKVTLKLDILTDMEAFCSGCHPGAGEPVEKGQIVRDIHVSGKVLEKKKHLDQVAKYNAQIELLIKGGKPHNLPIVLEKRMVVEGGKEVEKEFFTCESCHTLHWERGSTSYARAPFRKSADLCQGCHP